VVGKGPLKERGLTLYEDSTGRLDRRSRGKNKMSDPPESGPKPQMKGWKKTVNANLWGDKGKYTKQD